MSAIVWSKDNCPNCSRAKALLKRQGIEYEERMIGQGYTKEDLLSVVPNARSVPQIMIDNQLVGGFDELTRFFHASGQHCA